MSLLLLTVLIWYQYSSFIGDSCTREELQPPLDLVTVSKERKVHKPKAEQNMLYLIIILIRIVKIINTAMIVFGVGNTFHFPPWFHLIEK